MRDARTGEALFGAYSGMDTGRGMIGDVLPDVPRHRGLGQHARTAPTATWACCTAKGEVLGATSPRHQP